MQAAFHLRSSCATLFSHVEALSSPLSEVFPQATDTSEMRLPDLGAGETARRMDEKVFGSPQLGRGAETGAGLGGRWNRIDLDERRVRTLLGGLHSERIRDRSTREV
jgi:hypothetical protein